MNTMMQGLLSASLSGSLMVLVFLALRYLLNGLLLHMAFNPSSVPDTLFPDSRNCRLYGRADQTGGRRAADGGDGDTGQCSCYGNGRRKRYRGSFRDCRD